MQRGAKASLMMCSVVSGGHVVYMAIDEGLGHVIILQAKTSETVDMTCEAQEVIPYVVHDCQ